MKNINDFLSYDTARYGEKKPCFDVRYSTKIFQVEKNLFCLESEYSLNKREDYPHWQLQIIVERIEIDIPEEEREWLFDEEVFLPFHLTSKEQPTIEEFSEHIFNQGHAILNVLGFFDNEPQYIWRLQQLLMIDWKDITPQMVFKYMNECGYPYEKTTDFIYHYDFWESRLYHTIKYFGYLVEGGSNIRASFEYPIGEMLLHFLECGKFYDYKLV